MPQNGMALFSGFSHSAPPAIAGGGLFVRLPEEGESDRFGNLGDAFVGGEKETLRLAETHRTEKIREGRVHSAAEDAGEIRRGNADGGGDLSFGQDGIVFFDTGDGTAQDLPLPPDAEERFFAGVTIDGGEVCKSARLFPSPDRLSGRIVLTEGKYHQVKRMTETVGCRITSLERVRFADIPLDPSLARGEFRPLTEEEIEGLRAAP